MAAAVHIPIGELSADARALLERANEAGEIVVDGNGMRFKIQRMTGRTAAESLEILRNSPHADVEVDEDWAKDMREIIAFRHMVPDRDHWE